MWAAFALLLEEVCWHLKLFKYFSVLVNTYSEITKGCNNPIPISNGLCDFLVRKVVHKLMHHLGRLYAVDDLLQFAVVTLVLEKLHVPRLLELAVVLISILGLRCLELHAEQL